MSGNTKPRHTKSSHKLNNHLRIIAGKWRGRKVEFPDSQGLRPTSDRIRETLFNWLAPVINDAHCLDLFSGSGALSFEALSRGAAKVTMIDANIHVSEQLRQNLKLLKCDNANLLTTDAITWLKEAKDTPTPFDIVFLDPPFNQQLVTLSCELLEGQGLVEEGCYIYIETEATFELQLPLGWRIHREKKTRQVACYLCIKDAVQTSINPS